MITNADITVCNRCHDPATRTDSYCRTVIRGVRWYGDNRVALTAEGLRSADVFKVRIPLSADTGGSVFVSPDDYTGAENTWTLKADDYISRGIFTREISRPADLKKETSQVFRITSWSDNRHGGLRHWRAGGE